jgi:hypothetical protein
MLDMKDINFPYLTVRAGKLSALLAASFVLPALAFAGSDNGKGNSGSNNGNQYGKGDKGGRGGDPQISSVPEANPGIVLIPFVGAVLIFSSIQLLRMKAQNNG